MNATTLNSSPPTSAKSASGSRRTPWSVIAGRIISGIALAMMTLDVGMKLAQVKEAVDGTVQLGFKPEFLLPLGLIELACLVLYAIPRTAPLGATLLTAYLGGAVAIHVQLGNPMFTHVLSPVYVAVFVWGGLYLRDTRVRAALGRTG